MRDTQDPRETGQNKKTHVKGMDENLCDVAWDRDVRKVTLRTSRFVAVVNERIDQSLH